MKPPLIDTPLTRYTEHLFTAQRNKRCAGFEMDYYKCASQVGIHRMKMNEECKELFEDFLECVTKRKQKERYVILQEKLKSQNGPYLEKPPADTFIPN